MKNGLKRAYVSTCLDRHRSNRYKLWQTIRRFWPSEKKGSTSIKQIGNSSDNTIMADNLNNFFCGTGARIQAQIPAGVSFDDFKPDCLPPVFELREFTLEDVAKAIDRLSNSCAISTDGITSLMIKSCKCEIVYVLCYIYNMSVKYKTFPDLWKSAHVTPLFKSGCSTDPGNYRPISVLPTCGKILERLVHTQCIEYLEDRNLLSSYQSGFRSKRSTGTCLAEFLNNIYSNVDAGRACAGIFLDLSKAFDCVEHETLLCKLKCLGFKSCLVNWFRSYLENRTQLTVVNNVCSSTGDVLCGVPQGSILGPMLFICYINDLERHLLYSNPSLFADDTALLVNGSTAADVSYKLNTDLRIVSQYFAANKLQLNLTKTKCMFFHNGIKYRNANVLEV